MDTGGLRHVCQEGSPKGRSPNPATSGWAKQVQTVATKQVGLPNKCTVQEIRKCTVQAKYLDDDNPDPGISQGADLGEGDALPGEYTDIGEGCPPSFGAKQLQATEGLA